MSKSRSETKNHISWEYLFKEYAILQQILSKGFYEITSETINKIRESRLMTKFDHHINLPEIFRKNNLSKLKCTST
ncbi:type II restriction enzyme [Anthocerotibacter panamensis]|uniref:type II restriction enzyme n=1 Tax=Anthocerotibacter panamensis TaxID=2857077 RepID=UPI0036F2CB84